MKRIQNLIIFFLCLCVVGFFANFAQNDYGIQIVAFSILFVGLALCWLAVNELQHFKNVGKVLVLIWASPLILAFLPYDFMINLVFISLLSLLVLITVFPFIVILLERKKENKTNFIKYFENTLLAFLCIGNHAKIAHVPGAGPLIVLSTLIMIPLIWDFFKQTKGFFKTKEGGFNLISSLQIILCIIGFSFKIQHWPGANYFIFSSVIFLVFALILYVWNLIKIKNNIFKALHFTRKISMVSFAVMLLFFVFRLNGIAPKLYSNEFPNAYYELNEKANNLTAEGKANAKKADIYRSYYLKFKGN
jgi:hypothetical protein